MVVGTFLGWRDVPLADMVTAATGLPCAVANDVRALTYAEAWFGAGRGKSPFALITLGVNSQALLCQHRRLYSYTQLI